MHFGFYLYNSARHNEGFLSDLISFTHTYLEHMEQYSKGKTLKIRTQKKRKVKKQKGRKLGNTQHDSQEEDQGDKDFDPDRPDELSGDDDQEDGFHDDEMDEESEKEEAVERQFNFVAEIALLVDYQVISQYMKTVDIKNNLSQRSDLLQMTASFFKRVIFQLKQVWIFYQLEYLDIFQRFLAIQRSNNSLMSGVFPSNPL